MSWFKPTSLLDRLFETSLLLKGLSGLAELIAGFLLFGLEPKSVEKFISLVTQRELLQDPNDQVANWLSNFTEHLSQSSHVFLITYLWVHAAIKLTAVIGILRNQTWSYPFSLITLGALMIYQVYSILFVKASTGMILLTAFDLFVLWMIWQEFLKVRLNQNPNIPN
ncbi:MAG: hypothetical protein RLZZ571_367 [Actinomycetota bacterium]|jgi:uncharacterized membrane protein